MFSLFLENMVNIGILYLILISSVGADTLAGIQLNVKELDFGWDKEKFQNSMKKAGMIALVLLLLIIPITFLPYILNNMGVSLDEQVMETISILAIATLLAGASVKYYKDAYEKLKKLFNMTDEDRINLIRKKIEKIELPTPPEKPEAIKIER